MTDWPLARYGIGSIPWVASLFTPEPWRYWLWAGGTLIDLVLLYGVSPELIMKDASAKADHVMETRGPRGRRGWRAGRSGKRSGGTSPLPAHTPAPERSGSRPHKEGTRPAITLQEARTDTSHLGERLGLYVIIVLGEGIIQVIDAMAEHEHWDVPLILTSLGAFALLVGI
ncbi:low temperature requirement protein A [Streptomyces sp. NPDC002530]